MTFCWIVLLVLEKHKRCQSILSWTWEWCQRPLWHHNGLTSMAQWALKHSCVYSVNTQGEKCTAAAVNHTVAWEDDIRGHQFTRCICVTHSVGGWRNRMSLFVFFFLFFFSVVGQLGLKPCWQARRPPRHRSRQQHEHLSAARSLSLSNSRSFVGRVFCTSTPALLFFVVFFILFLYPVAVIPFCCGPGQTCSQSMSTGTTVRIRK